MVELVLVETACSVVAYRLPKRTVPRKTQASVVNHTIITGHHRFVIKKRGILHTCNQSHSSC